MAQAATITSQVVARGSYGIAPTNMRTGRPIGGNVIKVWHVEANGNRVGTYATRAEAREAAR